MNQYQKQILDAIKETWIISFNHLRDATVKEKKMMSDRTFRSHLKELVKSNKILRIKSRNQHVFYTTEQKYQILLKAAKDAAKIVQNSKKQILNCKYESNQESQPEEYIMMEFFIRYLSNIHLEFLGYYEMTNDKTFLNASDEINGLRSVLLKQCKEI